MATKRSEVVGPLTGGQLRVIRRWLGLQLAPFAELTSEGQATIARREQHNKDVTGPAGALLVVLNYLYELRKGAQAEKVEQLRQILVEDPTRRHFIGRFGAAALVEMVRDSGIPMKALEKRIQAWCEVDHQATVKRVTANQLKRTSGLNESMIAGLVAGVLTGLSWAWLKSYFASGGQGKGS